MRERPILFSGPMVRAILAGRKTQTRRLVKLPGYTIDERDDGTPWPWRMSWAHGDPEGSEWGACPYGRPGDRLWVRETWRAWATVGAGSEVRVTWRADDAYRDQHMPGEWSVPKSVARGAWGPSILMPRWASRLTLDVVRVRVERLQDISEADVAAEGITPESVCALWEGASRPRRMEAGCDPDRPVVHLEAYGAKNATLDAALYVSLHGLWRIAWTLINGTESWEANPWVWVVEFAPDVDAAVRAQLGGGR